jgi:putative addiction module component (TIGR02574 family)
MVRSAYDLNALRQLSVAERLELIDALWESVAAEAPDEAFPVTPELATELERRWAEYQAHPDATRSWEEIRADLLRRRPA